MKSHLLRIGKVFLIGFIMIFSRKRSSNIKRFYVALMSILLLIVVLYKEAKATWAFEFFCGLVYNFTTPLTIRQLGYEDINIIFTHALAG